MCVRVCMFVCEFVRLCVCVCVCVCGRMMFMRAIVVLFVGGVVCSAPPTHHMRLMNPFGRPRRQQRNTSRYNSNQHHHDEVQETGMRAAMEDLLNEHSVDLVLAGHVHACESLFCVHVLGAGIF